MALIQIAFTFFFLLIASVSLLAQKPYTLEVIPMGVSTEELGELLDLPTAFASEPERNLQLKNSLNELHREGYIAASWDSLRNDSLHLLAQLYIGERFETAALRPGNVDQNILSKIGYRERMEIGLPFQINRIRKIQDDILVYMENHGHPFADIGLADIIIKDGKVSAELDLVPNRKIIIDSVLVIGKAKITSRYIQNYLGIKPGMLYQESAIKKISTRIKELPFVQEDRAAMVEFVGEKAKLKIFLKKVKASKFDLIVGVLPPTNAEDKVQITGDGEIYLQNVLGAGEEFKLEYSSYPASAKELNAKLYYPYLPLLPIGADFDFNLYLRDTLYRDVNYFIGLQYNFSGNNFLKFFFKNNRTSLISVDSTAIVASQSLPANLDMSNSFYGLSYNYENVDYRWNPRKGFTFSAEVALGTKKIFENNGILALSNDAFNFQNLYDSLDLKSLQYKLDAEIEKYWPIRKRSTIKTAMTAGVLRGLSKRSNTNSRSPKLFDNELYRIGGNQLLRGFDEQSIFVDLYAVLSLEYRFLLGQNSYMFTFFDGAYTTNTAGVEKEQDFPYGFGAGITFETKAGVFGLSYALGSQQGNKIQLRSGKIHLGYVNYF